MSAPKIEHHQFGEIVIDDQRYNRDVIIYPDRVESRWRREESHSLSLADVWEVVQIAPEVLVIGQGRLSRLDVPAETWRGLQEAGIEVIAEPTG